MPNTEKKKQRPPIGISDFRKIREENYYFVDKSAFIDDVIGASAEVLLFPRPRRFGKTLNLSMLRYFFEKTGEDRAGLFTGLAIAGRKDAAVHQGRYPVVFLTFKDIKARNWSDCFAGIRLLVQDEFTRHRYLLDGDTLHGEEKFYYESILKNEAGEAEYASALKRLSAFLGRHHGEKVVLLIDEYDTPIHAAYAEGYYPEIISFVRAFLGGGLKDNSHLFRGVLTGILRVAKESVFSGLNNLGVYSLLSNQFADAFGFTEPEAQLLLREYGMESYSDELAHWYNGYRFGGTVIYNPWSVLNFVDNRGEARPYWANTASTDLIDRLATHGGKEIREEIGTLFEGGAITRPVYEAIVLKDVDARPDLLWSFLLFSGYLTPVAHVQGDVYSLRIPNREVVTIYRDLIRNWFADKVEYLQVERMITALENGDIRFFERMLRTVVLQVMSYHDLGNEPEKVFHALVLGMLVWMSPAYEIRSNRESGYGRYDLMLKPRDVSKTGIVIEFKKVAEEEGETPEKTLVAALEQIQRKRYVTELEAGGIRSILQVAIAFRGKELWVRSNTVNA